MAIEATELMQQFEEASWELHTIRDFIRFAVSTLNTAEVHLGHGSDDPFEEATAIVMYNLNMHWDADPEILDARLLSFEKKAILEMLKQRVFERKPVGYLTHIAYFCDLPFYVDERVLIPRSPIAELIQRRFDDYLQDDPESILDLCTGSGCIAIALAEVYPNAVIDAVDLSEDALEVAAVNVETHEVEHQVMLIRSNLFEQIEDQMYDLIVCNPPYVSSGSMADLPEEYGFEPEMALEAGRDGLVLVRRILAEAGNHLNEAGILILEVGESRWNLEQEYREIDFNWLEFECDAEGVLVLTQQELLEYRPIFEQRRVG